MSYLVTLNRGLSGFVSAYQTAVLGSNPKQTIML